LAQNGRQYCTMADIAPQGECKRQRGWLDIRDPSRLDSLLIGRDVCV
jgi:hypothetical protein